MEIQEAFPQALSTLKQNNTEQQQQQQQQKTDMKFRAADLTMSSEA